MNPTNCDEAFDLIFAQLIECKNSEKNCVDFPPTFAQRRWKLDAGEALRVSLLLSAVHVVKLRATMLDNICVMFIAFFMIAKCGRWSQIVAMDKTKTYIRESKEVLKWEGRGIHEMNMSPLKGWWKFTIRSIGAVNYQTVQCFAPQLDSIIPKIVN